MYKRDHSGKSEHKIACDDCGEELDLTEIHDTTNSRDANFVTKVLKKEGWSIISGPPIKHYCPDCSHVLGNVLMREHGPRTFADLFDDPTEAAE